MRRTIPFEPIEPAEPLSHVIKGRYAPRANPEPVNLNPLILIRILVDPAVDISLLRSRDRKSFCRDILCDGGAGGSEGSLSDMDRSDQVCIASDESVIINGAAMLVLPVKIDRHCTASEIDILAQIRIAAVDEMR